MSPESWREEPTWTGLRRLLIIAALVLMIGGAPLVFSSASPIVIIYPLLYALLVCLPVLAALRRDSEIVVESDPDPTLVWEPRVMQQDVYGLVGYSPLGDEVAEELEHGTRFELLRNKDGTAELRLLDGRRFPLGAAGLEEVLIRSNKG